MLSFQFECGGVICVTWFTNSTQVKHTDGTHIIGIDKAAGAFICKIFRITGKVIDAGSGKRTTETEAI